MAINVKKWFLRLGLVLIGILILNLANKVMHELIIGIPTGTHSISVPSPVRCDLPPIIRGFKPQGELALSGYEASRHLSSTEQRGIGFWILLGKNERIHDVDLFVNNRKITVLSLIVVDGLLPDQDMRYYSWAPKLRPGYYLAEVRIETTSDRTIDFICSFVITEK
jgi:hypothetical protein